MPPPDSSLIDAALVGLLLADSTLAALVPDGVFMDEGPDGAQRFIVIELADEDDLATFGKGRTIEDALYQVKAVVLSTAGSARAAAARIDVLLEDQVLTVAGYTPMTMHREKRLRVKEVDEQDASIRWDQRGGWYRVQQAVA
jgi:hypothetical protein